MSPFERRMIDNEAARSLRAFVLSRASKRSPAKSWNRWVALAEAVHHKVCTECCTWDDVLRQIEATRPSPEPTTLQEIPSEHTPAERPASKKWLGLW